MPVGYVAYFYSFPVACGQYSYFCKNKIPWNPRGHKIFCCHCTLLTTGFSSGLPGNSDYRDSPRASEWGETHPVNRIGARLANVLGGTNNTTPVVPNVKNLPPKQQYHIEWTQEGDSDEESDSKDWQMVIRGPIKISMTDPVKESSKKERPPMKPMFPPLPKSPSESWLCSAVPASKNQTKIPRAISLKSLPAAEVEGNTWESKALQCIEVGGGFLSGLMLHLSALSSRVDLQCSYN